MSDLSLPPLSLLPMGAPETGPARSAPGGGSSRPAEPDRLEDADTVAAELLDATPPPPSAAVFVWPTPALPCYAAASERIAGQACEVEGLNGKTTAARLLALDPAAGTLQLKVPPSKTVTTLRFEQFRRLRLQQPLAASSPGHAALEQRPALPYRIDYTGAAAAGEGLTLAPAETAWGLFLFEPVDRTGTVRRSFIPRQAYTAATIGQRIGETLVEQQAATSEQVQGALAEQTQLRSQRLGEMLIVRQIITPQELGVAIDQQAKMPMIRIGEALSGLGFITREQLDEALGLQKSDRSVALGELMVRKGMVSRRDLQTALARKMGYPLVDPVGFPADADALRRLPHAVAARLPALPLMQHGGRLVVALEDPTQPRLIDEIEFAAQTKVVPVLARTGTLADAIDRAYEKIGGIDFGRQSATSLDFEPEDAGKLLAAMDGNDVNAADDEDPIEQSDNSLVRLINTMILEAQAQGVSDIHVETQPGREKVRVRFRKDGVMKPYMELPHTYRAAIIARLKIMCDLDISERRKPQDGKINFGKYVQGQRLELRVATIPTFSNLEDAVLRLLASAKPLALEQLNLSPTNLGRLKTAVGRPYGMFLCVGPTGSGKTTTLHSALGHINTPDRKIWTAEDPIEITQPGLRQVQVNAKIDWTFARALRAFLRADPDVVMVGEIRDGETAQTAIEASLTGHLVLSTLHTNSAPETVTRLLDMGMDPFNFADALLAVLAQRLVRRLCSHCRAPREASSDDIDELLRDHRHAMGDAPGTPDDAAQLADWTRRFGGSTGKFTLYKPVGCDKCDGGYRGRAGIHELMPVSRALRQQIQSGARSEELQRTALSEGMRTLRQDGIEKVLAGVTTLDEVRAVSN